MLVGLSIDGPQPLHDAYRVNKAGRGSHAQVEAAWWLLRRYDVDTNVLCTVHAANVVQPLEVYRYFRDVLGATWIQLIPIVERVPEHLAAVAENRWRGPDGRRVLYRQVGDQATSRSVAPSAWGEFLVAVFDEWLAHDVATVHVQHVESMVGAAFGVYLSCVHAPQCGRNLAVEHNGDVYSCDHFVEPGHLRGNVMHDDLLAMVAGPEQEAFGRDKLTGLTAQCRRCPVRWACHGGCPKDRFATSADGEAGHELPVRGLHPVLLPRRAGDRRDRGAAAGRSPGRRRDGHGRRRRARGLRAGR